MAGEKFSVFIAEDPLVTALPLPPQLNDRVPVVRGTPPDEATFYASPISLLADPVVALVGDGIARVDGGGMTSGAAALTGSGFVAADVGKAVAVYDAGTQFLLSTITLSAVGSGYVVNELITTAGGTYTVPVQLRVAMAGLATTGDTHTTTTLDNLASTTGVALGHRITGAGIDVDTFVEEIVSATEVVMSKAATATAAGVAIQFHTGAGRILDLEIVNPGIYTVTAATLTQASTVGGSGAGATFTTAFVRGPLNSTIAAYVSATEVTLADAAAATVVDVAYAYGTDFTTQIQEALSDTDVRRVSLGYGTFVHTASITMPATAKLFGQGIGNGGAEEGNGSVLLYLGAPLDDAQIVIDSETGVYIDGLLLDGFFLTAQAMRISNAPFGAIGRLKTARHTQVGMNWNVTVFGETCSNWDVQQLTVSENDDYGLNVHGLWTGYPNTVDMQGDPNQLHFDSLRLNIEVTAGKLGVPWQSGALDHCTVVYGRFRGPEGTPGFEALGSNWASLGHTRQIVFLGVDVGEGPYLGRGVGFTRGSGMNHFFFYDQENGSPAPVLEPGAELRTTNHRGLSSFLGLRRTHLIDLQEPTQDPNTSAYIAMLIDSPTAVIGADVTKGGPAGSNDVLVAWTGAAGVWRVIADLNVLQEPRQYIRNSTATLTSTNDTAFDAIPGLEFRLFAGTTYKFTGMLVGTAPAGGGIKFRLTGGGALACSALRGTATVWDGTTVVAVGTMAALGDVLVAFTGVYSRIAIEGVAVCTAGGNLTASAAQNVADPVDTTVLVDSWIEMGATNPA